MDQVEILTLLWMMEVFSLLPCLKVLLKKMIITLRTRSTRNAHLVLCRSNQPLFIIHRMELVETLTSLKVMEAHAKSIKSESHLWTSKITTSWEQSIRLQEWTTDNKTSSKVSNHTITGLLRKLFRETRQRSSINSIASTDSLLALARTFPRLIRDSSKIRNSRTLLARISISSHRTQLPRKSRWIDRELKLFLGHPAPLEVDSYSYRLKLEIKSLSSLHLHLQELLYTTKLILQIWWGSKIKRRRIQEKSSPSALSSIKINLTCQSL